MQKSDLGSCQCVRGVLMCLTKIVLYCIARVWNGLISVLALFLLHCILRLKYIKNFLIVSCSQLDLRYH